MEIGYNTLKALADAGDPGAKQALCQGHVQAWTFKRYDLIGVIGTGRRVAAIADSNCAQYGRHCRGW